MSRPQVLLADDHTLFLEAVEKLLEDNCDVVGRAADGERLLVEALRLKPDVVVLDMAMPLLNGLEAARQLKQMAPETRIVFLTMNEDPDVAAEAFRAGASAYVLKRSAASELLAAIRDVARHGSYVTPLIADGLVGAMARPAATPSDSAAQLTDRQREVIKLLAQGRSMKEVGAILNIVPRTVAFHKYRIMELLHLKSTAELVQFAVKHRIV
ncbi:MAG TPA: response regulator transcription factor [Vicinamibacterales bacterium]|jgi:DNA-binding NarL/FixJ family response regulator|nr:response regulator transcription factor [Vicinamibacterales bacterium]